MYQPNQEPDAPYLSRTDVCRLIELLSPREIGKTQFYVWLEVLEEVASEPYSNWVAAQMVRFGELLNRPKRLGGTLFGSKQDLQQMIDKYSTKKEFIEATFNETQNRLKPRFVWVYPETLHQGQTIEVRATSWRG